MIISEVDKCVDVAGPGQIVSRIFERKDETPAKPPAEGLVETAPTLRWSRLDWPKASLTFGNQSRQGADLTMMQRLRSI